MQEDAAEMVDTALKLAMQKQKANGSNAAAIQDDGTDGG
jgi:hypothetical protein